MTESKALKIQTTFDGCYNYKKLKAEGMVGDWRYSEERLEAEPRTQARSDGTISNINRALTETDDRVQCPSETGYSVSSHPP